MCLQGKRCRHFVRLSFTALDCIMRKFLFLCPHIPTTPHTLHHIHHHGHAFPRRVKSGLLAWYSHRRCYVPLKIAPVLSGTFNQEHKTGSRLVVNEVMLNERGGEGRGGSVGGYGGGATFIIHVPTHGVATTSCPACASSDCGIILLLLQNANLGFLSCVTTCSSSAPHLLSSRLFSRWDATVLHFPLTHSHDEAKNFQWMTAPRTSAASCRRASLLRLARAGPTTTCTGCCCCCFIFFRSLPRLNRPTGDAAQSSATLSSSHCHHTRPYTCTYISPCHDTARSDDSKNCPDRSHGRPPRAPLGVCVWICSTNPYLLRLVLSAVTDDSLTEIHPNPPSARPGFRGFQMFCFFFKTEKISICERECIGGRRREGGRVSRCVKTAMLESFLPGSCGKHSSLTRP